VKLAAVDFVLAVAGSKSTALRRQAGRAADAAGEARYLIWTPEIARLMTRRWISEVPSKIV